MKLVRSDLLCPSISQQTHCWWKTTLLFSKPIYLLPQPLHILSLAVLSYVTRPPLVLEYQKSLNLPQHISRKYHYSYTSKSIFSCFLVIRCSYLKTWLSCKRFPSGPFTSMHLRIHAILQLTIISCTSVYPSPPKTHCPSHPIMSSKVIPPRFIFFLPGILPFSCYLTHFFSPYRFLNYYHSCTSHWFSNFPYYFSFSCTHT